MVLEFYLLWNQQSFGLTIAAFSWLDPAESIFEPSSVDGPGGVNGAFTNGGFGLVVVLPVGVVIDETQGSKGLLGSELQSVKTIHILFE